MNPIGFHHSPKDMKEPEPLMLEVKTRERMLKLVKADDGLFSDYYINKLIDYMEHANFCSEQYKIGIAEEKGKCADALGIVEECKRELLQLENRLALAHVNLDEMEMEQMLFEKQIGDLKHNRIVLSSVLSVVVVLMLLVILK